MIINLPQNIKLFVKNTKLKNYISFLKNLVKILDNLGCLPEAPFRVANLKYHKLKLIIFMKIII